MGEADGGISFIAKASMAMASVITFLIGMACWRSVIYIEEQNDKGNEDRARDIGIYIGIAFAGLFAVCMGFCALSTNAGAHKCLAVLSIMFSGMFITIAATQTKFEEPTRNRDIFLWFAYPIGILLFFSGLTAGALSAMHA
eukprot:maker-scaffold_29-snap-gene-3.28-mRNA-1 protein AED:0.21 eAED:0.21 QI:118/1/1/1/1/1/2/184/140